MTCERIGRSLTGRSVLINSRGALQDLKNGAAEELDRSPNAVFIPKSQAFNRLRQEVEGFVVALARESGIFRSVFPRLWR